MFYFNKQDWFMFAPKFEYFYKIALLGDSGSGKTSIRLQRPATELEKSPVGADFSNYTDSRTNTRLQMWEFGCDRSNPRKLVTTFFREPDLWVYCVDLSKPLDKDTKDAIAALPQSRMSSRTHFLLVGTKSDLPCKITIKELKDLGTRSGYNATCITNVTTKESVEELYSEILKVASSGYIVPAKAAAIVPEDRSNCCIM